MGRATVRIRIGGKCWRQERVIIVSRVQISPLRQKEDRRLLILARPCAGKCWMDAVSNDFHHLSAGSGLFEFISFHCFDVFVFSSSKVGRTFHDIFYMEECMKKSENVEVLLRNGPQPVSPLYCISTEN